MSDTGPGDQMLNAKLKLIAQRLDCHASRLDAIEDGRIAPEVMGAFEARSTDERPDVRAEYQRGLHDGRSLAMIGAEDAERQRCLDVIGAYRPEPGETAHDALAMVYLRVHGRERVENPRRR